MAIDIIWEGKMLCVSAQWLTLWETEKIKTLNNAVINHVYIIMQDDHFITLKNSK